MALQLFNTYERNTSFAMALAGKYANVRFMMVGLGTASPQQDGNWLLPVGVNSSDCSVSGYANGQWCSGSELARFPVPEMQQSPFMRILALPYYWAERLTDLMGDEAIPLGLVFNPVGGTMIEQWTPYAEQLACTMQACMCSYQCNGTQPLSPTNQSQCDRNAQLWRGDMQPIVNMTIKGWLWYQGEVRVSLQSLPPFCFSLVCPLDFLTSFCFFHPPTHSTLPSPLSSLPSEQLWRRCWLQSVWHWVWMHAPCHGSSLAEALVRSSWHH